MVLAFTRAIQLVIPKSNVLASCRCDSQRAWISTVASMSNATNAREKVLFAIRTTYRTDKAKEREESLAAHYEWSTTKADTMFAAFQKSTDGEVTGALNVIRASSQEVDSLLQTDPFSKSGIYADLEVRQWFCGIRSDSLPDRLFMVWCVDRPNSLELRKETRPRHLDWIRNSKRQGLLGPFPVDGGACGSLLIVDGENIEDARAWARNDPYAIAGLFQNVDIVSLTTYINDGVVVE